MNKKIMQVRFLFLISILILNIGCNEEKAEAIKIAAEKFRTESITALDKIRALFTQSISMPIENSDDEIERIAEDLNNVQSIGANELSVLMTEDKIGNQAKDVVNEEFERMEAVYYQFEAIFRSLKEGSYFSKDAVRKAEKHAVNLTVQMINFAKFLKEYSVQFTGRRVLIVESIANAKIVEDDSLRLEYLKIIAKDILQLRSDENKARDESTLQCLKAAEAGKLVTDLIRNYDSLKVEEILISTRNALNFINEMSNGNSDLTALLNKYDSVVTKIQEDPYWNVLLDKKVVTK
ncbi:MAG: hypothetical protein ACE5HS_13720 [bacterium]